MYLTDVLHRECSTSCIVSVAKQIKLETLDPTLEPAAINSTHCTSHAAAVAAAFAEDATDKTYQVPQ